MLNTSTSFADFWLCSKIKLLSYICITYHLILVFKIYLLIREQINFYRRFSSSQNFLDLIKEISFFY